MARNFWFDAFAADKGEKVSLPPVTKAERIANLKAGIEMYRRCAERASTPEEASRHQASIAIREDNLKKLTSEIGAAA